PPGCLSAAERVRSMVRLGRPRRRGNVPGVRSVALCSGCRSGSHRGRAVTTRTTVHLLRHGEVFNPTKVLYGRLPDFHLSDAGVAMAEAAARAVTGRDVVRVVASPLER